MVAVNRIGTEGPITFYGSSFISDPYGRILVQAPGTNQPCWWLTSTSISARTGSSCSVPAHPAPDAYGSLSEPASSPVDQPFR